MLAGFKFNVSHQEIERILSEIETWWETLHEQTGQEWMPTEAITNFLLEDLGYEDMDDFEDALQGTFVEFLAAFPHIEVNEKVDRPCFKVRPLKPGPPRRMLLVVESTKQLLETTFMKAVDAEVELPELEFSIGADNSRHIDSLYNHIATARDNLEQHAKNMGEASENGEKVMDTVRQLTAVLDVEKPLQMVVHDASSRSEFLPMDGVTIVDTPGPG
mmetsp:Transcript_118249/g.252530  ORF Transcript_118249/g.252530 Transcript_118249/m.252530 type:complete len:217 (-) Transcript_118249:97-747(-)